MLVRERAIAFARRQRTGDDPPEGDDPPGDEADAPKPTTPKRAETERSLDETKPMPAPASEAKEPETKRDLPAIEPPTPVAEPWPDATPPPMTPVRVTTEPAPESGRAKTETVAMPAGMFGRPPEMPKTTAPPPVSFGDVEDPTHMPGPREIPGGEPSDPAAPPGRVPPGDSRSLRHDRSFALIYRIGTYVISRVGIIGTRGQWRVVEYPTSSAASHSYAKECSRFASEGFSDYRE